MIKINKLETISHRPGIPKKLIFLPQNLSGKRFEYMETEKKRIQCLKLMVD